MPNASVRWQMRSLYRQLDGFRRERVRAHRMVLKHARKIPDVVRIPCQVFTAARRTVVRALAYTDRARLLFEGLEATAKLSAAAAFDTS